ncbi:unnamed protein product [Hymenolepis diminuta]|uniref:Uncharacterized protein n=1 Tax=Hymenolepis diminuta TaxID=6216 RepID=A0A564YD66_HYMDI|nr:unnamed protein product [Hymenolepis diminuta]
MKPVKRHEHQQSRSQRRGFRDGPVGAAPQLSSLVNMGSRLEKGLLRRQITPFTKFFW